MKNEELTASERIAAMEHAEHKEKRGLSNEQH
jgi:hypothetical protein